MYSINSVVASGSVCSCVLLGKRKKERKKERRRQMEGGWVKGRGQCGRREPRQPLLLMDLLPLLHTFAAEPFSRVSTLSLFALGRPRASGPAAPMGKSLVYPTYIEFFKPSHPTLDFPYRSLERRGRKNRRAPAPRSRWLVEVAGGF